jgi:hypothetical protein
VAIAAGFGKEPFVDRLLGRSVFALVADDALLVGNRDVVACLVTQSATRVAQHADDRRNRDRQTQKQIQAS